MVLVLDVLPWEPSDWPKAFATSPWMSTTAFVIFRGIVAIALVGHAVAHFLTFWPQEDWFYFIYFSRWVTALEVLEEILHFATVFWGSRRLRISDTSQSIPVLVKVVIVLFSMVLPSSILSAILYYAFAPSFPPPVPYVSLFVHGGDVLLLNVSFFASRFPYTFGKFVWVAVLAWSFAIWTVIHFFAKIGRDDRDPCGPELPLNECPIYGELDWRDPLKTGILLGLATLLAPPVLGGLYAGLTYLRDRCDPRAKELRERQLLAPYLKEEGVDDAPEKLSRPCLACGCS